MIIQRVSFAAVLMMFTSIAHGQEQNRRDGNWWRQTSAVEKSSYLVGFFDGLVLGERFSYWEASDEEDIPFSTRVTDSFRHNFEMLKDVKNTQLKDGVEVFYNDYRNCRIRAFDAIWIVLNSIYGKPDKEVEAMTAAYRKNSQ